MINRLNIVDKFSTFLSIIDNYKFTLHWITDYKLKKNIQKIISESPIETETLAYQMLIDLRINNDLILQHHLASYLQEISYWATRYVYYRLHNIINALTLDECFLFANEAITQPEKLLRKYQFDGGSKMTTYANTRLKTLVTDKIYLSRNWKLLTNWGLLKKIAKSRREKILQGVGGLKEDKLKEYLLVWQCFVDNYVSSSPHRNKSLSPPNFAQLNIMTQQYNLLGKKILKLTSDLTVEEFKTRVEFCGEKARLFINPVSIEFSENKEINQQENNHNYLTNLEINQENAKINQILANTFQSLNVDSQSIFYLAEGFGFTQQQVIQTIKQTNSTFPTQQYQLSRNIEKIRKLLLDAIIKNLKEDNKQINIENIKSLIQLLKQWLTEYIESEILLLCRESFLSIETHQQESIKETYFKFFFDTTLTFNYIPTQLIHIFRDKLNKKLNLKLEEDTFINDNLNLWLEKFFHQYFNQV